MESVGIFQIIKKARMLIICSSLLLLSACTNYEYHTTSDVDAVRVSNANQSFAENELLNVGIVLFDSGLDLVDEDDAAFSSVRQSEAVWFSSQLKDALEYSNAWGVVRVMPGQKTITDVTIAGKILESTGEVVRLQIDIQDAIGSTWISKEYGQRASAYSYHPDFESDQDPFQSLFNEIANDVLNFRAALTTERVQNIRNVSRVRFAQDLAPEAFEGFLVQDKNNEYALQRLPADNDPMINRITRIQARNDLFLDVVQDYYRVFNQNMTEPYDTWRGLSYREAIYQRQLKEQSRKERVAGLAGLIAGVLAQTSDNAAVRTAGSVAIVGGATVFRSSFVKADEANLHAQTLRELGDSLEAELEPSVINLQERSITLSGTVEEQFKAWRKILAQLFIVEQGGSPNAEKATENNNQTNTLDAEDKTSKTNE